nr:hypothetical protein [Tanacetum cinerariifolium]
STAAAVVVLMVSSERWWRCSGGVEMGAAVDGIGRKRASEGEWRGGSDRSGD